MRLRTASSAGLFAGALAATLWIAVGSAFAATTATPLGLDGSGAYVDYASDARGTFRPLDLGLVTELVGEDGLAGIGVIAPPSSGFAQPVDGTAPPSGGSDPTPPRPPTVITDPPEEEPPPPQDDPGPKIKTSVDAPILRVTLSADRAFAARGEVYTYTIEVTNIGRAPATNTRLTSHVPEHTSYAGTGACGNDPVAVGGGVCVNTDPVIGPGDPTPDEHIEFTIGTLASGQTAHRTFAVKVKSNAPHGYVIYNHAHAEATGAATVRASDAGVRVQ